MNVRVAARKGRGIIGPMRLDIGRSRTDPHKAKDEGRNSDCCRPHRRLAPARELDAKTVELRLVAFANDLGGFLADPPSYVSHL